MRTTLDLPEDLLEEIKRAGNFPTKRAAVVEALEDYARRQRRVEFMGMLGKIPMSLTQEELQEMRAGDDPPEPGHPMRLIPPPKGRYPCLGRSCRRPKARS